MSISSEHLQLYLVRGAGEQQLICMARVLVRRPSVIFLDEATAHTDSNTAAQLQQLLGQLAPCCAIIQIAHRKETVLQASKVLVMEQGEIVERGDVQLLTQDSNSKFSQLHSVCK